MIVKIFKKLGKKEANDLNDVKKSFEEKQEEMFQFLFETKSFKKLAQNGTHHVLIYNDGDKDCTREVDLREYGYEVYENGLVVDRWA